MPNHQGTPSDAPPKRPRIVAIGEIIWDLLPSGAQLGGAPANFALDALALGGDVRLISRVGRDRLGEQALAIFRERGLPSDTIQRDDTAATSTASVKLDAHGHPHFVIHEDVAWDRIVATNDDLAAVAQADAICFGTLAQRTAATRAAVQRLVAAASVTSLRMLDVNLRPPYVSAEVV
ncbi:MAG TPA: PfkB family carbohydrate kinase, partial [Pirellulales bacterium]|nr:PfkB family carbohydrate kinase [Pirellulales bacterium]